VKSCPHYCRGSRCLTSPLPYPLSSQDHPGAVDIDVYVDVRGQSLCSCPFFVVGCSDRASLSLSLSPVVRVDDNDFFHVDNDDDNEG